MPRVVQHALGPDGLNRLIRYAHDRGIRYIDTAESYRTFQWIGDAIKSLPRESLSIQSKIPGTIGSKNTAEIDEAIERMNRALAA